ncbi:MAG: hypothetical protein ACLTDP_01800 [Terrisporobacter sp.]
MSLKFLKEAFCSCFKHICISYSEAHRIFTAETWKEKYDVPIVPLFGCRLAMDEEDIEECYGNCTL